MTRADLIAAIASRFRMLTVKDNDIAVKEILDAIGRALAQGDRIEIRGFGSYRQDTTQREMAAIQKPGPRSLSPQNIYLTSQPARNYGNA